MGAYDPYAEKLDTDAASVPASTEVEAKPSNDGAVQAEQTQVQQPEQ